jgi:cobalt-zinc-cadmium efflux system outer membrane protein
LPTIDQATAVATSASVELLAVDREVAIEERRLSLLKAERVPTPFFSFGTVLNAPGEFNVGAHAGVSLALPLFSRNQGEIMGSVATIDAIRARRDALRRQIEARVYAAVERMSAQRAQVEAFRATLVPTATALQGLAEESYRLGRSSILAALDAQRSLRDVKYEYLQSVLNLQAAVADLEDILGGPIL